MTAADNDFRLDTAVLLIGFNRVGPLRQVFESVRQARPPRLQRPAALRAARALLGGAKKKIPRGR